MVPGGLHATAAGAFRTSVDGPILLLASVARGLSSNETGVAIASTAHSSDCNPEDGLSLWLPALLREAAGCRLAEHMARAALAAHQPPLLLKEARQDSGLSVYTLQVRVWHAGAWLVSRVSAAPCSRLCVPTRTCVSPRVSPRVLQTLADLVKAWHVACDRDWPVKDGPVPLRALMGPAAQMLVLADVSLPTLGLRWLAACLRRIRCSVLRSASRPCAARQVVNGLRLVGMGGGERGVFGLPQPLAEHLYVLGGTADGKKVDVRGLAKDPRAACVLAGFGQVGFEQRAFWSHLGMPLSSEAPMALWLKSC
jgi:hypothetical protein